MTIAPQLRRIRQMELSRGMRLTERQSEVAKSLLISGHALDLVVGVAGSGKTSTMSAVREGFEAGGYHVIGAATSGRRPRPWAKAPASPPLRWRRSPGVWSTRKPLRLAMSWSWTKGL